MRYIYIILLLIPLHLFSFTIDDFENDGSKNDQADASDAEWWTPNSESYTTMEATTEKAHNSTHSLKIIYNKSAGREWDYFSAGALFYGSGNIKNYSVGTYLSAYVYGNVRITIKFKDKDGNDTESIGPIYANSSSWNYMVWDYSKLNWQNCNSSEVQDILFFINPGATGSGQIYIDDFIMGGGAASSNSFHLLIDNFNDGDTINRLGGESGIWPDSSYIEYSAYSHSPDNIKGRSYSSLKIKLKYPGISPDGSGLWMGLNNANLSKFKTLSFWIKGETGGEDIQPGFKNFVNDESRISVTEYLKNGVTTSWQKVIIPLSAFKDIQQWEAMNNISFGFDSGLPNYTVYIDDIILSQELPSSAIEYFYKSENINALNGTWGGLGAGSIEFTNQWGIIKSGTDAGELDDFDDGDFNNYFGGSISRWSNDNEVPRYFSDNTRPYRGTGYALRISYELSIADSEEGISLGINDHDVSSAEELRFVIKGSNGGEAFGIRLEGGGQYTINITDFVTIDTNYQLVRIPLTNFSQNGVNLTSLQKVSFTFDTNYGSALSGAFYIDQVEFYPTGSWFTLEGFNASKVDKIRLLAKGNTTNIRMSMRLENKINGVTSKSTDSSNIIVSTNWQLYNIDLSQFQGIQLSDLNALHISVRDYNKSVYIDDLEFADISAPALPYNLKLNGKPFVSGAGLSPYNFFTVEASSYYQDFSMEGLRFEYSLDGLAWNTISVDYKINDTQYELGWGASELSENIPYFFRVVAQDISGNESSPITSDSHFFKEIEIFYYPNPFNVNTHRNINFIYIPKNSALHLLTLTGEHIITLKDNGENSDDRPDDGKISWDGKNRNNSKVAPGLYLFFVKRENEILTKGKFAVIK